MHEKIISINNCSYSRFLKSKEFDIHCLKDSAVDVEFFKRSIALHYQHVYASQKRQNCFYRYFFFSLSVLFLILGIIICFKTTNYICGLYFSHYSVFIKNFINICCFLLASASFIFGYKIHPEKEAVRHLFRKIEKESNSPAKQFQIEFNAIFANLSKNLY